MMLPTEPIGSIPRPLQLIEAIEQCGGDDPSTVPLYDEAVGDNVAQFESMGVQIDFTEGRLAIKIDPSGKLLNRLIDFNNPALSRFSPTERQRIGVHTCPGSDRDSTHSADVDYAEFLPSQFELKAGNFYIALAGEREDRSRLLKILKRYAKSDQRVFIGVVSVDPRIETPEEIRDRILEAPEYLPIEQLGTTDDCGLSPFCDDRSTSRATAFAKIRARAAGTALALEIRGVSK